MTSSNKPTRIDMPCAFAQNGTVATIKTTQDNQQVNFSDGFPAVYGCPASGNGKFVTRGEMNAIGNLATRNDFYFRCGGINDFSPEFSALIGGYPSGAVLDYLFGGQLMKVISLIDNNTVDYRNGNVDGINWAILNTPEAEYQKNIIRRYRISSASTMLLGTFVAPDNGVITANFPEIVASEDAVKIASGGVTLKGVLGEGFAVIAKKITGATNELNLPFAKLTITSSGVSGGIEWNGWANIGGSFGAYTWFNSDVSVDASIRSWMQLRDKTSPSPLSIAKNSNYAIAIVSDGFGLCGADVSQLDGSTFICNVTAKPISVSGDIEIALSQK